MPFQDIELYLGRQMGFTSALEVIEHVAAGLPRRSLLSLVDRMVIIGAPQCQRVLGVSGRTMDRFKADPRARLDPHQSSRVWSFAEVLVKATQVLGSQEDAELWLSSPAIALDGRKPIELMVTAQGVELVKTLLDRMAYGVYT